MSVEHDIHALARDAKQVPVTMHHRGASIVARNVERGNLIAQGIAKARAGKHGKNYYKRMSAEMVGPLEGEYGPSAVQGSRYVGVSGSEGAMRDLVKSADRQTPRFHRDIGRMVDGLFWPGGG